MKDATAPDESRRPGVIHARLADLPGRLPLTIVTGPTGIGRTTAIADLRADLGRQGVRTLYVRFAPSSPLLPPDLDFGPDRSLFTRQSIVDCAGLVAALAGRRQPNVPALPDTLSGTGIQRSPAQALASIVDRGEHVLLLDDAQWIDPEALGLVESLVRLAAGTTVWCVAAVRTPLPTGLTAASEMFERLRRDGLARQVRLRPLGRSTITGRLTELLQARPAEALTDQVRRLTAGVPGAINTAVQAFRRSGSIRLVDRHAYLVPANRTPELHEHDPLLTAVRGLGMPVWSAAKAVAVLAPMGRPLPALVAEAMAISPPQARELLNTLCERGVLQERPVRGDWRFRLPMLADALIGCMGPWERRRLAQIAVQAVTGAGMADGITTGGWHNADATDDATGTGRTPAGVDPDYLADQLAAAGRLVDAHRACATLLTRADAHMVDDSERAKRWLRAAADLTPDRKERAGILVMHAAVCVIHGDYHGAVETAEIVLNSLTGELTPEGLQEIEILHLRSLRGIGSHDAMEKITSGEWWPWPDDPAQRIVTTAVGLSMLDRWRGAHHALQSAREQWQSNDLSACLGNVTEATAGLYLGRPQRFEQNLAAPQNWIRRDVERYRLDQVVAYVRALLAAGDLTRAEGLLASEHTPAERLLDADRVLLAMMRGEFDRALDLMREVAAAGSALGYDPREVRMHQAAAGILIGRGRLARARELLTAARVAPHGLLHLLDAPDALADRALGEPAAARLRLRDGLAKAADHGLLIDTETLWLPLLELCMEKGDLAGARECVGAVERVATLMQTSRSTLYLLMATAMVDGDRGAGEEAVRLARERGQPPELAQVIERMVRYDAADPALLPEAYTVLGDLDALLYRAWLRNLMRDKDVAVPGRRATVAENERLLAVLTAEGLGNRQLATVLQTSEKSVEGRLSRLFSRTGYRSRVDLAAAMLSGEYES